MPESNPVHDLEDAYANALQTIESYKHQARGVEYAHVELELLRLARAFLAVHGIVAP